MVFTYLHKQPLRPAIKIKTLLFDYNCCLCPYLLSVKKCHLYMSTGAQKINHLGFMASVTLHKLWITSTGNFKICACGEEIRVLFWWKNIGMYSFIIKKFMSKNQKDVMIISCVWTVSFAEMSVIFLMQTVRL